MSLINHFIRLPCRYYKKKNKVCVQTYEAADRGIIITKIHIITFSNVIVFYYFRYLNIIFGYQPLIHLKGRDILR